MSKLEVEHNGLVNQAARGLIHAVTIDPELPVSGLKNPGLRRYLRKVGIDAYQSDLIKLDERYLTETIIRKATDVS